MADVAPWPKLLGFCMCRARRELLDIATKSYHRRVGLKTLVSSELVPLFVFVFVHELAGGTGEHLRLVHHATRALFQLR